MAELLCGYTKRNMNKEEWDGYVGADITALTKEAAMHALRRVLPDISTIKDDKPLPDDILEKLIVTDDDFNHAFDRQERDRHLERVPAREISDPAHGLKVLQACSCRLLLE